MVVNVRGDDDLKYISQYTDTKTFRQSRSKGNLFHVATNHTKDLLSVDMELHWKPKINLVQPFGFMNFPTPSAGKYLYENFFSHYEAEHKIVDKASKYRWVKKTSAHQNHLFDVRNKRIMFQHLRDTTQRDYLHILFLVPHNNPQSTQCRNVYTDMLYGLNQMPNPMCVLIVSILFGH